MVKHPNYLFGKLNLASKYHSKSEYEKVSEILGENLELQKLYPDRDTFHIVEVTEFLKMAILYFSGISNLDEAKLRLGTMEELIGEESDFIVAKEYYDVALMQASFSKMHDDAKNELCVDISKTVLTKVKNPPKFTHSIIEQLYKTIFSLKAPLYLKF